MNVRLAGMLIQATHTRATETTEERNARLEGMRQHVIQNMRNET